MLDQPLDTDSEFPTPTTDTSVQVDGVNPFPGLRPFSLEESHLFFGRELQVKEILKLISTNKFVSILGYSGSGKSSLVSCGLIPALHNNFVAKSNNRWKIVTTRPGALPIQGLVNAIVDFLIKEGSATEEEREEKLEKIDSTLRSGSDGLIQVAKYLQTDHQENIFLMVDQFEELFRFRSENSERAELEAHQFVNLILNAVTQDVIPFFAALTMRSDFIGECAVFPDLTQLINNSNYLVPQMSAEQKRMAIVGPISLAGGEISERLVTKLLSDMGNNQDQLPILQHALMRTWDYWLQNKEPGEPMDIRHYKAIGQMSEALSQHANEAYDELSSKNKLIAEVLFKSITERTQENRGIRRPCRLDVIAKISESSNEEVMYVVEQFRKPGRSFLMPGINVALTPDTLIELSHESLMRIWNRLEVWVEEEFESASRYKRLSDAAAMYQIGKTGLWRPPDLQLALNWQKKQRPTREWAQRYDEAFERSIVFLDTSRITYEAELKNQEMMQKRVLRRARVTAAILGIAFIVAILFFVYAYLQKLQSDTDRQYAEEQTIEAQVQKEEALKQKSEADRQRELVQRAKTELETSIKSLEDAFLAVGRERDRAEDALMFARLEQERAERAGEQEKLAREQAQENLDLAEANLEYATSLYFLTKAQELASKAAVEEDDYQLSGLQAMQGFTFHKRHKGKKYDPFVYRGLYSALTKLNNVNYNAMKIQGPPRVHLRSLVVTSDSEFYVAGADGRVYQGNIDKLTNSVTKITNPYPSKVIAMSKDQSLLINGSDSAFVQLYNMKRVSRPLVVKGLSGPTNDIQTMPDDSGFIITNRGNTISKISYTGKLELLAELPYDLKTISISPDSKTVAAGTWTGKVILFDLQTRKHRVLADENSNRILSIKYSGSGNLLAYGVEDITNKRGLVKLYDFETQTSRQFTGHKAGINDVEFSEDEKLLASAGLDKRLQLYVLENAEDLPIVMDNNNGYVWDIAFVKGSNMLIATCSESEIRIWPTDPSTLAELICPKIIRNMSADEWKRYVGKEITYETTCANVLSKEN
jgi:energy-coupling factor transporter ATP-binding protein EcfA2